MAAGTGNIYADEALFLAGVRPGRRAARIPRRESAAIVGEVDVVGKYDYLDVWNHERFTKRLAGEPFTDDDARALAEYGV